MSLTKYRAFICVVEQGSLTKAAKVMGYSQPGISKMIEALETEWDISLFSGSRSYSELTENGMLIYNYCKRIIKLDNELLGAVSAMHGLLTGSLRIGALNSIIIDFVPNLIKAYNSAYPIIQIYLNELNSYEVVEHLKNDAIDIGFTSRFHARGLEFLPLFKDPVRLIVNKEHPFASYDKVTIDALNGCDFIMLPPEGQDLIAAVKEHRNFTPAVKFYVHSDAAAISMVSANLGVYIISDMQCQHLPENIAVLEFEENVCRTMGLGLKSQKNLSLVVKEMIKIAKNKAGEKEFPLV